jgi:hypothetical protein
VKLIGEIPAFIGLVMISLDPFLIALNKILHPDNFLPGLMLLSSIAFITFLKENRKARYLVIAAVAAGTAWCTRVFGLYLIPYISLLSFIDLIENKNHLKDSFRKTFKSMMTWFLIAFGVFALLWPAMWVTPTETLSSYLGAFRFGLEAKAITFFNGEITTTSDLPSTFYLIISLWRTTPFVVIGLILALLGVIIKWGMLKNQQHRKTTIMLILFPVFYIPIVSVASLKTDKYVTSILPILDLVAAIGWVAAVDSLFTWIKGKYNLTMKTGMKAFLLGIAIIALILPAIQIHPYYWSYYNPLFGGTRKAVEILTMGYGEGLDAAAAYLEEKPDDLIAFSYYGIGPFSYYFSGEVQNMILRTSWQDSNARRLAESDYVVTYINQWQRGMTKKLLDVLEKIEPEHTVMINGVEYAKVYKTSDIPPDDYQSLIQR